MSNIDTHLDSNADSGSNSSFTSAVGTPTTSKNKANKSVNKTLKHYFLSNRKVTSTSSHVLQNSTSRSAVPATSVPDITSHLPDDNANSTRSAEEIREDIPIASQRAALLEPLEQRTPRRGSKRMRNASKNTNNYVETHDARLEPTFTFDMQKFVQFLPADFQLLTTHKLKPSLLQSNNREFVPVPEAGVDLFVRARAGMVLQVRSEKRATLLDSYVQRGIVPKWAVHMEPMPGYIHPVAEKVSPLRLEQANILMTECAIALRKQARVIGERAMYDQEVLERTFQRDRHGYQVACTRLNDIREREKQRIHLNVEEIEKTMSYEPTTSEDVVSYIKGKVQRRYIFAPATRGNPRGRGTRGRARGGLPGRGRGGAPYYDNRRDYGYQRDNFRPPQASTSGNRGRDYNAPEYNTQERNYTQPRPSARPPVEPPRTTRNISQETVLARERSRSPLASLRTDYDPIGHYDNNRVGPPGSQARHPAASAAASSAAPAPPPAVGATDLSERDIQRIADAFMSRMA